MEVNVSIQWCGAWGFERKYKAAKADLEKRFGNAVHVISQKDTGTTGNFEISVDGVLIHSKREGDGDFSTQAKKQKVYDAITKAMADKEGPEASLVSKTSIQVEPMDAPGLTEAEHDKAGKRSLCVSILTLLISIPALVGAWCWPALVIAIVSGSVSAAARQLGHIISLIVTIVMMLIVVGFMVYTRKNRDSSLGFFNYNGPLILCCIATPFILADIIRHVLQDQGVWEECDRADDETWGKHCNWSSSQYHCTMTPAEGGCIPTKDENLTNLSPMGILFTIVFTYFGFACMMVGTFWNANICEKLRDLRDEWREIRGTGGYQDLE